MVLGGELGTSHRWPSHVISRPEHFSPLLCRWRNWESSAYAEPISCSDDSAQGSNCDSVTMGLKCLTISSHLAPSLMTWAWSPRPRWEEERADTHSCSLTPTCAEVCTHTHVKWISQHSKMKYAIMDSTLPTNRTLKTGLLRWLRR